MQKMCQILLVQTSGCCLFFFAVFFAIRSNEFLPFIYLSFTSQQFPFCLFLRTPFLQINPGSFVCGKSLSTFSRLVSSVVDQYPSCSLNALLLLLHVNILFLNPFIHNHFSLSLFSSISHVNYFPFSMLNVSIFFSSSGRDKAEQDRYTFTSPTYMAIFLI